MTACAEVFYVASRQTSSRLSGQAFQHSIATLSAIRSRSCEVVPCWVQPEISFRVTGHNLLACTSEMLWLDCTALWAGMQDIALQSPGRLSI